MSLEFKRAQTPKELGFRMPAEWEPHEATWISWPNRDLPYWGKRFRAVEETYTRIVQGLQHSETVNIQVPSKRYAERVANKLHKTSTLDNVVFYETNNMDVWTRDHGPVFVVNNDGEVAMTHWTFNGWGKFHDLTADTSVPGRIHELTGIRYFNAGMVLEGGSIEVNGAGTLLTTEQCLYNENRNKHMERKAIEKRLRDYLGVRNVVWLREGLRYDDTDGHIDNIARFASTNKVLVPYEFDRRKANFDVLHINRAELTNEGFDVEILPVPDKVVVDGKPCSASYANFYIGNKVVLAPMFGKPQDADALAVLKDVFSPERLVVPIDCVDLVASGGTIHCVTQQQPKGSYVERL